ncbi:MAG: CoB--CoM heterodisulfide reductase iron-sulfur subunit B family protein [Desulfobacterales bacterium]|nr:CoB--CoM heterodisulfide reductase iron-sulfur subunit B family protein [Desulfobacterales bacterium]
MDYALFIGCQIPARLPAYEVSARSVLSEALGIGLVDIKGFNCCGYPVRNFDHKAFILASARNLALAEEQDLDIVALCSCCYGSLKKAEHLIAKDQGLKEWVNKILDKEGLAYNGRIHVRHFLSVFYHDVGIDAIREKVTRPFKGLKIAAHYGCHALRPSDVTAFDDPVNPSLFDQLVEVTGAESVPWSMRLECCGAPLSGVNDALAMDLTEKKVRNAQAAEADYLCTACPYCQMQFDTVQDSISACRGGNHRLPSIIYPQLLGLSMGIAPGALKIEDNQIPIQPITQFLSAK